MFRFFMAQRQSDITNIYLMLPQQFINANDML